MKSLLFLFTISIFIFSCSGESEKMLPEEMEEETEEVFSCHESGPFYIADYFETSLYHEDSISIIGFEGPTDIFNLVVRTNDRTNNIEELDYLRIYFDTNGDLDNDENDRVAVSISPGYPEVCYGSGKRMLETIERCDHEVDDLSIVGKFGEAEAPFNYPHVYWEFSINMKGLITECDVNFVVETVEDGISTYYPRALGGLMRYEIFEAVHGYRTSL